MCVFDIIKALFASKNLYIICILLTKITVKIDKYW